MGYAAGRNPSPAQLKKLLRIFSEDLRKNPGDLLLRLKLAEVLRLLSRFEEAVSLYGSVAWSYAVAGNLVQAIMLCKLILELKPQHQETQQMLAKLYASKRIREEKQAVPVVNVDGRWVADPRQRSPGVAAEDLPLAPRLSLPENIPLPESALRVPVSRPPSHAVQASTGPAPRIATADVAGPTERAHPEQRQSHGRVSEGLANQAAQARARARREAAARSQAALAAAQSSLGTPVSEVSTAKHSKGTDHGRVTQVEKPKGRPPAPRHAGFDGPTGPMPKLPAVDSPPQDPHTAPAEDPSLASTGPMRPLGGDVPTSEAAPLARVQTSDDLEPLLGGASGEHPSPQGMPTSAELPAPPPMESNLPPTFVGKSPLEERPPEDASTPLEVPKRLGKPVSDAEDPSGPAPEDAPTPQGRKKRETLRLQTISTPGESQRIGLLEDTPQPATTQRRGRTLREGLEGTQLPSPHRPTRGYLPPPVAGAFPPPTQAADGHDEAPGAPVSEPQLQPSEAPLFAAHAPERRGEEPSDTEVSAPPAAAGVPASDTAVDDALPVAMASTSEPAEKPPAEKPPEEKPPTEKPPAPKQIQSPHSRTLPLGTMVSEVLPSSPAPPLSTSMQTDVDKKESIKAAADPLAVSEEVSTEEKPIAEASPPPQPVSSAQMLEPDGDALEELDPGRERRPKATARMPTAEISTLLRKDAEIAYREAKSTDCYAAIQREVLARGQAQEDSDLGDADDVNAEKALERTLQELPSQGEGEIPEGALPEIPLFSELDQAAFVALVERLEARVFDAGEFVIREGEPGDSLLLISAGELKVLKGEGEGQIELALLSPGSFFGEFGLLTDQRRHASVRCLEDTEVLELRRDVLADLIRDHPTVQQTLRAFYQRRVLEMVLATSPLFRAVSPEERDALIARFATRRYVDGEVIVREGEHAGAFFVILVGEVAVTCQDDDGTEVKVGALSEGQYFGEMSLISGYPAEATVQATRVTEVLLLDELAFYEMASSHPEIWAEVQRESQARAEANDRILAERRAESCLL